MKENIIKIGAKPFVKYIETIDFLIKKKNAKKIIITARGQRIKDAVDLLEITKGRGYEIKNSKIKTTTHKFEDNGKNLSTSCIEILLEIR